MNSWPWPVPTNTKVYYILLFSSRHYAFLFALQWNLENKQQLFNFSMLSKFFSFFQPNGRNKWQLISKCFFFYRVTMFAHVSAPKVLFFLNYSLSTHFTLLISLLLSFLLFLNNQFQPNKMSY